MKKAVYLILALVFCGVFYSCEEPKEPKEEKKEIRYTLISDDGIVYENFSEIYVYEFDKYNNKLRKHYIFTLEYGQKREIVADANAKQIEIYYVYADRLYCYAFHELSDRYTNEFGLIDCTEISEEEYNQRISQK